MTLGSESDVIYLLVIIFFSTLTRSTFGFGDSILAMPLLALTIGITKATPLVAMIAFTIALMILVKNWREVQFNSTWRLIVSSIIGIPIGIYFLKGVNESVVKAFLAIFIIILAVYNLAKPKLIKLKGEKSAYAFGFMAGVLGGAYNNNGPPVVFYGTLKQWPPGSFRVTLQGYFFATGIFMIIGHALAANYTPIVLSYYVISIPIVLTAIYIGGKLNRRIPTESFIRYVYYMLIIIGVILLINSVST
ncbi:MAG: sulfite exporter TauE/SafE family protein [bacterium]|nr:sulfite exporter TauE/SafE family protein [bacterium]